MAIKPLPHHAMFYILIENYVEKNATNTSVHNLYTNISLDMHIWTE